MQVLEQAGAEGSAAGSAPAVAPAPVAPAAVAAPVATSLTNAPPATPKPGEPEALDALIPQQLRRHNADNKLDPEQTLRAVAESYRALEGRMKDTGLPPKDVSEYKFEAPDGLEIDQERAAAFKTFAKDELGLSTKQYEKLMGKYVETLGEMPQRFEAHLKAKAEGISETLKTRVGSDKAAQMLADAEFVWQQIAPEGAPANAVLQDPAAVVQALSSLAKEMKEDRSFESDTRSVMADADVAGLVGKMVRLPEGSPERLRLAATLKAHSEAKVRIQERGARAGSV